MIRCSALRFFLVVSPPPSWLRVALLLAVISGCATLWLNPADVDSALGPILLLQMFSASSGFTSSAARGHFDPILVSHRKRITVALSSLVAASAPGVLAWVVTVLCASALGQPGRGLSLHRTVAMIVASCVGWGAGVALPRLAAGAVWSMVLLGLALSRGAIPDYLLVVRTAPDAASQVFGAATACFVCPFLLLGNFAGAMDPRVLALDVLGSAVIAWAAAAHLCRRDYPLVEPAA